MNKKETHKRFTQMVRDARKVIEGGGHVTLMIHGVKRDKVPKSFEGGSPHVFDREYGSGLYHLKTHLFIREEDRA